jgi:oligopeptide transport system permease protein
MSERRTIPIRHAAMIVAKSFASIFVTLVFCFLVLRFSPDGPFSNHLRVNPEIAARISDRFRFGSPIWDQFWTYTFGAIQGDFGPSFRFREYSVGAVISQAFQPTLILLISSLIFAVTISHSLEIIRARLHSPVFMGSLDVLYAILFTTPVFVIAWALQYSIALHGRLPIAGWGTFSQAILPTLSIGLPFASLYAFAGRWEDQTEGTRRSNFTAEVICASIPFLMLTTIIVERSYDIPGMGRYLVEGAIGGDYTLDAGFVFCLALIGAGLKIAVDFTFLSVSIFLQDSNSIEIDGRAQSPANTRRSVNVFISIAAVTLLILIAIVLIATFIYHVNADDLDFDSIGAAPSLARGHLLGTDLLGRDLLSELIVGLRTNLVSAAVSGSIICVVGFVWGRAILATSGVRRKLLLGLAGAFEIMPWPPIAILFAAGILRSPWLVLAIGANVSATLARFIGRPEGTSKENYRSNRINWAAFALVTAYVFAAANAFTSIGILWGPNEQPITWMLQSIGDTSTAGLPLLVTVGVLVATTLSLLYLGDDLRRLGTSGRSYAAGS